MDYREGGHRLGLPLVSYVCAFCVWDIDECSCDMKLYNVDREAGDHWLRDEELVTMYGNTSIGGEG